MSLPVLSHLRPLRRAWALTHSEMARLLGIRSQSHISRLERYQRLPRADVLLACHIVFATPIEELFPRAFAEIEEQVICAAEELFEKLKDNPKPRAARKRELLAAILSRAVTRLHRTKA